NQRPLGVVCDRDIVAQSCGDIDDLRAVPISAVMVPCTDPLGEGDSVGTALRKMCAHRQWHLPIVCARGLFVGALDVADLALWLRDRLTILSVEAAFRTESRAIPEVTPESPWRVRTWDVTSGITLRYGVVTRPQHFFVPGGARLTR